MTELLKRLWKKVGNGTGQKIFSRPARKDISGRYDAAETTGENHQHWRLSDSLSADAAGSRDVRRTLRNRSRYEISNNSYAKGVVEMLANDTIGTGARLQVLTDDEDFNEELEESFSEWSDIVKLTGKLRLMRIARCQDGETFGILTNNPKSEHSVQLDLQVIEADRVTGESGDIHDGIRYDEWGNPVKYRVLKYHPGGTEFAVEEEAMEVDAENMLHLFRPDRPEQHRGIPELSAALPLFAQLRRYNLSVLSAAEAAADFSAILYTDTPPDGQTQIVEPMDSVPLERNMMLTVPAGWKMEQLEAKHPTSGHSEFVKIILSEIARCTVSTYGAVSGDYSGHNYASGRLDNQLYHKSIVVDRRTWETEVLDRIFRKWYREYTLLHPGMPWKPPRHTWFWDGFMHVDPTKEAAAQRMRLNNHTTTLAAECARDGQDYMSVLRQRAKELRLMKELGLSSENKGGDSEKETELKNTEHGENESQNECTEENNTGE